jgi:hypothetical protein
MQCPWGKVRVAIQVVGPWASVKELFRAIDKQQTRPVDWRFRSKRGSLADPTFRRCLIDVEESQMIRQGTLAYAQHTFVPHGDAKYRCDPVGGSGYLHRAEDTQTAASAGQRPTSSAQVPPEPGLFKWGDKQESNAWIGSSAQTCNHSSRSSRSSRHRCKQWRRGWSA